MVPEDWMPNGSSLLTAIQNPSTNWDIWQVPALGPRRASPVAESPEAERFPRVSPDGRWLAYRDNRVVHVRAIDGSSPTWDLGETGQGSGRPIWGRDGRDIFYIQNGKLWDVAVKQAQSGLEFATPRALFDVRNQLVPYFDVASDGRFLIPLEAPNPLGTPMTVVTDWTARLSRR
jgi:hypothetical protein